MLPLLWVDPDLNHPAAQRLDQRARRVQRHNLTVVDDRHPVAQPLGLFHVVRRVDDRHAGVSVQPLHVVEDVIPALRIHANRRLVQDQQLRLVQQARRQVQPTLHAA